MWCLRCFHIDAHLEDLYIGWAADWPVYSPFGGHTRSFKSCYICHRCCETGFPGSVLHSFFFRTIFFFFLVDFHLRPKLYKYFQSIIFPTSSHLFVLNKSHLGFANYFTAASFLSSTVIMSCGPSLLGVISDLLAAAVCLFLHLLTPYDFDLTSTYSRLYFHLPLTTAGM